MLVALSSRGGATRVVTLLRMREMKPPSPLPLAERAERPMGGRSPRLLWGRRRL